mmetsp:Transcript_7604/g.17582  ORF Transcript_7604/g.17582 Transcript_7604/m.17582 type:complete len:233 (-) Transcript_7604:26-724(-)
MHAAAWRSRNIPVPGVWRVGHLPRRLPAGARARLRRPAYWGRPPREEPLCGAVPGAGVRALEPRGRHAPPPAPHPDPGASGAGVLHLSLAAARGRCPHTSSSSSVNSQARGAQGRRKLHGTRALQGGGRQEVLLAAARDRVGVRQDARVPGCGRGGGRVRSEAHDRPSGARRRRQRDRCAALHGHVPGRGAPAARPGNVARRVRARVLRVALFKGHDHGHDCGRDRGGVGHV